MSAKQIASHTRGQMVTLLILLSFLIFQLPSALQIGYQADQLKTLNLSSETGFYNAEKDPSGNQFSWTSPRTSLDFNLAVPRNFKITLEVRSAVIAGGPDAPVQVVVNGSPVREFSINPASQDFQKISLDFSNYPANAQQLEIELLSQPYQPKGDPRTLGFMVKSVQVENLDWAKIPSRLNFLTWLLVSLVLLSAVLSWRYRQRPARVAGYALAGLNAICAALALGAVFLLGSFTTWLDSAKSYLLWTFGLAALAIILWQIAANQPFGQTRFHSLYRWAFRRVNPQNRSGAVIPFKGVASIEALTGLRAIAAFMVFTYHYPLSADSLPRWLYSFTRSGNNGVPLFFTLSGFVICYNYYDRLTIRPFKNLWPFLVNRFARIYPVYLLVFLVSLTIIAFTRPTRISPAVIWQQTLLLQSWNPDVRVLSALIYNVPSWSVSVEIFLYISFPLVALFLLKNFQRVNQLVGIAAVAMLAVLLLAVGFLLTGHTTVADYGVDTPGLFVFFYFPVTHLSEFISGCAAARIYVLLANRPVSPKELTWGRVALVFAIAAVIFLMIFDQPYMVPFRFASGYIPFFTIIVFCLARYRTLLSRFLSTKPLILLGEASYSFYMWHEVVLVSQLDRIMGISQPLFYLVGLGIFLFVVLISIISFKFVETPLRKLIRRLALPHKPASPTNSAAEVRKVEAQV